MCRRFRIGSKKAVCEAQDEDVLNGLLAKVMIDAENLPLVEHLGERVVDGPGAHQVVSNRLFHDHSRDRSPVHRRDKAGSPELLDRGNEDRRRNREVINPIVGSTLLMLDHVEPRTERRKCAFGGDVDVHEIEQLRKFRPELLIDWPPRKAFDTVARKLAVLVIRVVRPADANHDEMLGEEAVHQEVVERRDQFAVSEIARTAEDEEGHECAAPPRVLTA